ncbi:type I-E CRISPR-associated protein Cse1/CasA [Streptomyces sp. NA04227]|uniref:type I-E CRISPR-associated protein Cse1/CasA n=1 Tax=Streptomyces sp. NA04227 TaxID=2742136 RepID=UPI0015923B57|nr:type I-E CRISPR-associated protein Cse1/CasA [Streptomyces sp. NA04227]QKW06325.1 type I-E CRISPR-associated protein Cse1/CasA [Streptomyces sp. NA04227]
MWNLLDEPWLTVSGSPDAPPSGNRTFAHPREISARELVLDAHLHRELLADPPTQRPAIYRQLLLPLVVDALGFPEDAAAWARMFTAGRFDDEQRARLAAYLDAHHHLFDLFSPDDPFAQVAGLTTAGDATKSAAVLVATAALGNNVPLFSSRTEGDLLELTPAQAARWLLHVHCWDTGAIKTGASGDPRTKDGKTTGNPVGPLGHLGVTMPLGTTVYETLLLNIPYGRTPLKDDLPQWRRRARDGDVAETLSCATPSWTTRAARGLLDVWTWQARRVRLVPGRTSDGELCVSRALVAAGDRLMLDMDHEPHTAWHVDSGQTRTRRSARGDDRQGPQTHFRPVRHASGRAAWRGLDALLAVRRSTTDEHATAQADGFHTSILLSQLVDVGDRLPGGYGAQVELTGIRYGKKLGNIEDAYHDEIPLPLAALRPDSDVRGAVLGVVEQAEELARAVNSLSAELRRALGVAPPKPGTWQYPGETLLHALDPLVRRLLVGLREVGEDDFDRTEAGLLAWEERAHRETWRIADDLLSTTVTASAFTGREVTGKDGRARIARESGAEAIFRAALRRILFRRTAHRAALLPASDDSPTTEQ